MSHGVLRCEWRVASQICLVWRVNTLIFVLLAHLQVQALVSKLLSHLLVGVPHALLLQQGSCMGCRG